MQKEILDFLYSLNISPSAMVFFLSMLPVTELRASIPVGIMVLGQGVLKTFLVAVIGNILPIVPLYFFLEPVSRFLSRTRPMEVFFNWLFKRARDRAGIVERYEALGLMLFVGIPFPGTGVWTGCIIASLLRMRFVPTFFAASGGVLLAACIVTFITYLAGTG